MEVFTRICGGGEEKRYKTERDVKLWDHRNFRSKKLKEKKNFYF